MAGAIKFELDKSSMARFQHALNTYHRATRKEIPDVVNRAAMNLAFRSVQFTPQANRAEVEAHLRRVIGIKTHGKSGKQLKKPRLITEPTTAARAIVVSQLRAKGILKSQPPGRVSILAAKLVAARLRSIAFIRAGWLPAARAFQKVVKGGKKGLSVRGVRSRPGKGRFLIAKEAIRSFAEIVNSSTSKSGTSGAALLRYGREGFSKALAFVTNDMQTYANSLLDKEAKRFNSAR